MVYSLKKLWSKSKLNKWLLVSSIVFALGDVLTTSILVHLIGAGGEGNPIWRFVYGQFGITIGAIALSLVKYIGLIFTSWYCLRKSIIWLMWLFLAVNAVCATINTTILIMLATL